MEEHSACCRPVSQETDLWKSALRRNVWDGKHFSTLLHSKHHAYLPPSRGTCINWRRSSMAPNTYTPMATQSWQHLHRQRTFSLHLTSRGSSLQLRPSGQWQESSTEGKSRWRPFLMRHVTLFRSGVIRCGVQITRLASKSTHIFQDSLERPNI